MKNDKMKSDDVFALDRILTTYSMEEVAITIEQLCHSKNNSETKELIKLLQEKVDKRENDDFAKHMNAPVTK
jgi:hypothetical protein